MNGPQAFDKIEMKMSNHPSEACYFLPCLAEVFSCLGMVCR